MKELIQTIRTNVFSSFGNTMITDEVRQEIRSQVGAAVIALRTAPAVEAVAKKPRAKRQAKK